MMKARGVGADTFAADAELPGAAFVEVDCRGALLLGFLLGREIRRKLIMFLSEPDSEGLPGVADCAALSARSGGGAWAVKAST